MSDDFKVNIEQAASFLETIKAFHAECDPPEGILIRKNPIGQATSHWYKVVRCFEKAYEIYRRYNQKKQGIDLTEYLFDLVSTCDNFISRPPIRLLNVLASHVEWLESIRPGTREQLKSEVERAIWKLLSEQELDYWTLAALGERQNNASRSAIELWRDLAANDEERRMVDRNLCLTMELAAQVCLTRKNLDGAESWLRNAARVAQDRLGDSDYVNYLLSRANEVNQQQIQSQVNPVFIQALAAESPSSREYVEAMSKLGITESLNVLMQKGLERQHKERFLPPLEDFLKEYENHSSKLSKLVNDQRLLVDNEAIETRFSTFRHEGLLAALGPGQVKDSHGNIRGELGHKDRFIYQYIREVEELVGGTFLRWMERGQVAVNDVIDIVKSSTVTYDWRIFEHGVEAHFQRNFVCAAHVLTPQFENIIRNWSQENGIKTKQIKSGIEGEMLLNDLIRTDSSELIDLMGKGLFELVYWYIVRSASQFNNRNKVAHGWIAYEECNSGHLSAMTILLTLMVLNDGVVE